ncbi:MAG: NYN domain-containing protein [Actinobacteria bacterium]|nr:NYN domain-containing protein [Thermoleophilia bacterium]MCB9010268.1 NYN domain-containing protein [Actinomycetota bacterium]
MDELSRSLAVLVDYENMARPGAKGRGDFDIHLVLNRLTDKGRVLVKRAYADWSRYRDARHDLQNAGLELIEMPSAREGAKNRADIKMAVDAMELAFSREHLDTFVIVSGDSDFTPLVGKVRELNKRVIGVGNRESASELLIANCDEFIYYDLLAASRRGSTGRTLDPNELLRQTLLALQREGTEWPLASVVKDSMRRRNPAFDETEANFSTFSKFLEDARDRGVVRLESDSRSGTYRVELADSSAAAPTAAGTAEKDAGDDGENGGRGTRRRRRGRRRSESPGESSGEAKADVFEFVVSPLEVVDSPDIPLDRALTYEDMVMLGPELTPAEDTDTELLEASDQGGETPARRRRRRRSTRGDEADASTDEHTDETDGGQSPEADSSDEDAAPATSRRRRRSGGRSAADADAAEGGDDASTAEATADAGDSSETTGTRRRRRRSSAATAEAAAPEAEASEEAEAPDEETPAAEAPGEEAPATGGRRRVRRGSRIPAAESEESAEAPAEETTEEKPKRRRTTRKKAEPTDEATEAPADEATEE